MLSYDVFQEKKMTTIAVSVEEFRAHCVDMIRKIERDGAAIDLTWQGKVVARVLPTAATAHEMAPWQRLRNQGALRATPEESVLDAAAFTALAAAER